jgi:hypothetical protein
LDDIEAERKDKDQEIKSRAAKQTALVNQQVAIGQYSRDLLSIRSMTTTFMACLLPTAAIAALSYIHGKGKLTGAVGGLTALFAIGLMFFTSEMPSRVEIFSATAA